MADFLVDRIRAGTRNDQTVTWPGTDTRLKVRVLGRGEFQDAVFAAYKYFEASRVEVLPHTAENFEEEKVVQLLFRALSDMEGRPVASEVDQFRAAITKDELDELAVSYALLEQEVSPKSDRMSQDEFDRFVETLKKKPDETISSVRSIAFARRLLRSMAGPSES